LSRRESVSGVVPIAAATSFFDKSTSTRGASPYCSFRKRQNRSSTSVVVNSTIRSVRNRCRRISMEMKSSRKSSRDSSARRSRRGSRKTVHSVSATAVTGYRRLSKSTISANVSPARRVRITTATSPAPRLTS